MKNKFYLKEFQFFDGEDSVVFNILSVDDLPCGSRQRCRKANRSSRFYGKSLCVLHYRQQRHKLTQISGLCCGKLETIAESRQVRKIP